MLRKEKETSYFIFSFISLLFTIGVMLFSSISIAELQQDIKEIEIEYNKEIKELKEEIYIYKKYLKRIAPSLDIKQ